MDHEPVSSDLQRTDQCIKDSVLDRGQNASTSCFIMPEGFLAFHFWKFEFVSAFDFRNSDLARKFASQVLRNAHLSSTALAMALATLSWSPFFLTGCQSASPTPYVSPRITGRVLDARSRQPLAQVTVHRLGEDQHLSRMEPRHGGEALQQPPTVRTGIEGTFVLESERTLTPFRRTGWYVVPVAFDLEGYETKVINYTLANATNNLAGEPVINAGDILLAHSKP